MAEAVANTAMMEVVVLMAKVAAAREVKPMAARRIVVTAAEVVVATALVEKGVALVKTMVETRQIMTVQSKEG